MNTPLPPEPVVLTFLFVNKHVFLQVLALLALARVFLGEGLARWPALASLVMALGGLVAVFAPESGVTMGPITIAAAQGAGMTALLLPSAVFAVSYVLPRARWRWMDALHALMLLGLLGLWWRTV